MGADHYNARYQMQHITEGNVSAAKKHRVIRNAVKFKETKRRAFQNQGHSFRACSLQPFKIKEDWPAFVSTIGLPHRRHILVGDGIYLKRFRAFEARPNGPKLVVTGPLANTGKVLEQLSYHSDVFLHESVKPEAGSLAILEALSAGMPVICDSSGCLSEFVSNGDNGITVSSRPEMRDATRHLLSSYELWRRLSDGARERTAAYNLKHMIGEYRVLFDDILR